MSHRYDQCDATCTVDCGHCKGAGAPKVKDERAFNTEPEHVVRCALAWISGYDPELYQRALRRAHGDWT